MRVQDKSHPILLSLQGWLYRTKHRSRNTNELSFTCAAVKDFYWKKENTCKRRTCTLLFCWFASEAESFFSFDVEDGGFILTSSASKAGASVLTTASRSVSCVRDCTSEGSNVGKKKKRRKKVRQCHSSFLGVNQGLKRVKTVSCDKKT